MLLKKEMSDRVEHRSFCEGERLSRIDGKVISFGNEVYFQIVTEMLTLMLRKSQLF
jgi:hypothetical protein